MTENLTDHEKELLAGLPIEMWTECEDGQTLINLAARGLCKHKRLNSTLVRFEPTNIIGFKKPDDPNIRREIADGVMMSGSPIALSDGSTLEITAEGLGFTDMEAAMNMRGWLERACEVAGAKRVGGGIGFGQADIDVELEGCRFNISIRPLPRSP